MAHILDHLGHIAGNAANIAMHGLGAAVGDAANTAHTAANIAEEAARMAVGAAGSVAGDIAGGAASISREAANIAQGSVGEPARIAVNITGLARNMVPGAAKLSEGSTAAVKIAGEAARIAGGAAGGAVEIAANIVGSAAHIAGEASKMAGSAVEDVVGRAARIAAEADRIAGAVATGSVEGAAEGAAMIAAEAHGIAEAIATGAVQGAVGGAVGGAIIMGEAAKIAGEAAKMAGEAARIAGPAANVAEHLGSIASHITAIAGSTAEGATMAGRSLVSRGAANFFEWIADPNVVLNTVTDVFQEASDEVLRGTVFAITRRIFSAMSPYLGRVPAIYKGIFSNEANWGTLKYILSNRSMLAEFLVDLVEPAKLYAMANPTDGNPSRDTKDRTGLNAYNELKLEDSMNRHAAICQLQRLAKSIIFVLKDQGNSDQASLGDFKMDTRLETDNVGNVKIASQGDADAFEGKETWLFVNGIAGEPHWVQLACQRLADKFKRNVKAIFNRSDGILWDLVECAGERSLDGDPELGLIQRTQSSIEAQDNLRDELEQLLWPGNEEQSPVIIIAHSQGCLILRLVLEEFVKKKEGKLENMKRLQVFTFGNPSTAWEMHNYCGHTEHFANEKDFVAKLGVLRNPGGYPRQPTSTFINRTWTGHLFGTQYSLEAEDYEMAGQTSKLLCCAGGRSYKG